MCLVESPLNSALSTALNKLLSEAIFQNSQTQYTRVFTKGAYSKLAKNIYESFYCPPDLSASHSIQENDTGRLLKCFVEQQMDFENMLSKDEVRAIELCKTCLVEPKQSDAEALFKELCLISRKLAPIAGQVDWKVLVHMLTPHFQLKVPSQYISDWKKINQVINDRFSIIPGNLGNKLTINRTVEIKEVFDQLTNNKGVIIEGISGCGKTNLAKSFADYSRNKNVPVIWLDSTDFDSDFLEIEMNLNNSFSDLIDNTTAQENLLFVDGIERLFHKNQYQKLAILFKKILDETQFWKIILTCPSDQIEKLNQFFPGF